MAQLGEVILGKFEEEIIVTYTSYVNILIKEDNYSEAGVLLFRHQAEKLIEQLQLAVQMMKEDGR